MSAAISNPPVSLYDSVHARHQPEAGLTNAWITDDAPGDAGRADLRLRLAVLFRSHRAAWRVKTFVGQRVQTSPSRYYTPDLCIMGAAWKRTPVATTPPLLCIELLSPDDRLSALRTRCQEYLRMGVRTIWVLDTRQRVAFVQRPGTRLTAHLTGILRVPGTPIEVTLDTLFGAGTRR